MPAIGDARVLIRDESRREPVALDINRIYAAIQSGRETSPVRDIILSTANTTQCDIWLTQINSPTVPRAGYPADPGAWESIDPGQLEPACASTRATTVTATTVSAIRASLRMRRRDERVARMPADRRALYERILSRRERVGAVEFDLTESLKELRNHG